MQRPQNHRDKLGGVCAILSRARFNNSYQPLAALPGFTRGLDFCGRYAFVGLSQVRESAVFSGIQIAERPQAERFCGVWVIDIVTGEIVAWVQFQDALQEIFAVCVVPHRTWPEITNSNIGLISNSFVLPEEVLDTVPSELLKRVPVVTGDQPERASARLAKTRAQKTHPTKTSPRFSERMVIACHSSSGSRH